MGVAGSAISELTLGLNQQIRDELILHPLIPKIYISYFYAGLVMTPFKKISASPSAISRIS
jgi:hypothetical protein